MDNRLPYYMAYPMAVSYDDERRMQRDFDYMKSMYPALAKVILPIVEEECEKMAYDGSMIYDEYPDVLQLRLLCRRICEQVGMTDEAADEDEKKVSDLVQIMVYHELFYRRMEYRSQRRRFFFSGYTG